MNKTFRIWRILQFVGILMFIVLTPLYASPSGEIIYVHPVTRSEIWISNTEGTTARQLFRQTFGIIDKIDVQEDGNYVLVVADKMVFEGNFLKVFFGSELFLLDRKNPKSRAKNLTLERITDFVDADMSKNGDVAFIRRPGIRIIPNKELDQPEPEIELLLDTAEWEYDLYDLEWSPDGKKIAFTTRDGLFLFDVASRDVFRIIQDKVDSPVFSPDGKQIAYSTLVARNENLLTVAIAVVPVQPDAERDIIHVKKDYIYGVDAWSPDGKYLTFSAYTKKELVDIEIFRTIGNFVIPATGGEPEPILITVKNTVHSLDWEDKTYPVEPADSLVTTWGKLKAHK